MLFNQTNELFPANTERPSSLFNFINGLFLNKDIAPDDSQPFMSVGLFRIQDQDLL